ncbi:MULTISPECIES: hypothetical protein [Runella]|uniref:Uncharacterized protein n=1 Tax=Runella defluvii TaxID=370973 RepID=A0A7W5ZIV6_9BACT|nr:MULTISPECIES: hypothetical protein [Runella]MBB3836742.1 hypothetical protein [Runella defluvii]
MPIRKQLTQKWSKGRWTLWYQSTGAGRGWMSRESSAALHSDWSFTCVL